MTNEELKERKKKSGLTAQQIADKSGVPLATVQRIFAGQTLNPGFETMSAIIKAIDVPEETDDRQRLIEIYERVIKRKNKYIAILSGACAVLMLVFIFLLVWDFCNPNIGFIYRR